LSSEFTVNTFGSCAWFSSSQQSQKRWAGCEKDKGSKEAKAKEQLIKPVELLACCLYSLPEKTPQPTVHFALEKDHENS